MAEVNIPLPDPGDLRIAVLGLGYVGLPLAAAFSRHCPVIGFDTDPEHVERLRHGEDRNGNLNAEELADGALTFTGEPAELESCNVYVIAVPTPVDAYKRPDLEFLEQACNTVGKVIHSGDVVIFEATVYPGCTEEVCIPVIENVSSLAFAPAAAARGESFGFHVGYSPERINPGDGMHSLSQVVKVTSGSSPAAAEFVDRLYGNIVEAGTHPVSSIRVAEAAKVIENTQRDLNIALVNELAVIFNRLGIDTLEVLEAAGTKWNFLPFRPGLVGGHCIGVDPYYLTSKAEQVGYHPEVILAGRRINDSMGQYVAQQTIRLLAQTGQPLLGRRCLVLGLTFKENCPDLRNTRVVDIIEELEGYGLEVDAHDPWVDAAAVKHLPGVKLVESPKTGAYDAIVIAVAHRQFEQAGIEEIRAWGKEGAIIYDVKGLFPREQVDARL